MRYEPGTIDFTQAWIVLTLLWPLGLHRIYMGKIITGLIYLLPGGLLMIGVLSDFWTLNGQVSEANHKGIA